MSEKDIAERAREIGVPVIPKRRVSRRAWDPNPVIAICGECGRGVRTVEGYCCGNSNCPVQANVS